MPCNFGNCVAFVQGARPGSRLISALALALALALATCATSGAAKAPAYHLIPGAVPLDLSPDGTY